MYVCKLQCPLTSIQHLHATYLVCNARTVLGNCGGDVVTTRLLTESLSGSVSRLGSLSLPTDIVIVRCMVTISMYIEFSST